VSVSGVSQSYPVQAYYLNNFVDGDPLYLGKVSNVNTWLIQKFSTSTGVMLWANVSTNPAYTTYASAWANRLTLTYSPFQELSNV
jgi:hypothetical protein